MRAKIRVKIVRILRCVYVKGLPLKFKYVYLQPRKYEPNFFLPERKFKLVEIQTQILQFKWLHESEIAAFENEILRSVATFAGKRTNSLNLCQMTCINAYSTHTFQKKCQANLLINTK